MNYDRAKIMTEQTWRDINFSSFDGLNIYARCYHTLRSPSAAPVLCLPGLTRNSQDFHYIATYLSQQAENQREVYCIDLRGRGRSDYDNNWKNYNPGVELRDILDLAAIEGLHKTSIIGTSRGGIIAMIMASHRPTMIESVVLNDIGPVVQNQGLLRIRSYAGSMPSPRDWGEACQIIRSINEQQFTNMTDEDWDIVTRQIFLGAEDQPLQSYDGDLTKPLSEIDFTSPLPTMWPQFMALSKFPLLTIRGQNSDILSIETFKQMKEKAPRMKDITIEDEGHAPFMHKLPILEMVYTFLESATTSHTH